MMLVVDITKGKEKVVSLCILPGQEMEASVHVGYYFSCPRLLEIERSHLSFVCNICEACQLLALLVKSGLRGLGMIRAVVEAVGQSHDCQY
jgi:hypothetical protein